MLKIEKTPRWLIYAALGLGGAGCLLRWGLYQVGMDEKGLMEPYHILKIALWLVTFAAAALCLPVGNKRMKTRNHALEALGEAAAALGIAAAIPLIPPVTGRGLDWPQLVTAVLALAALGYGAWCRFQHREGGVLAYGPVCLFLTLNLVSRYQRWSTHPQVLDYCFQMLGVMAMMIFAYLRCVKRHHALRRRVALFGIFCCLTAVSAWEMAPVYLGGAVWMFTQWNAPGETA